MEHTCTSPQEEPPRLSVLDISAVAKQSGFSPSTLRYYEELGLIQSIGRKGLKRLFGPQTLVQLSVVSLAKTAGFSLEEITAMIGPDGQPQRNREDLRARADVLEAQITRLSGLRDMLRHAAECPHPGPLDCPKFQRLLHLATRIQRRGRTKQAALLKS